MGFRRGCYLISVAVVYAALATSAYGQISASANKAKTTNLGPISVLQGVYTMEQANRGQLVIADVCSKCHGGDLLGLDIVPAITGKWWWRSVTLSSLFRYVSNYMPWNAPNSLTRQQYIDAIAYMLWFTGYPPGSEELPSDTNLLDTIRVEVLP